MKRLLAIFLAVLLLAQPARSEEKKDEGVIDAEYVDVEDRK